jgi:DNA helicase-2/ATP-dependent DNA helicase PcrA
MAIHRQYEATGSVSKDNLPAMIEQNFYLPYATGQMADDMKAKATKAITEYFNENSADFDKIEFSEKEIEIDLGENIRVTGRIDLVRRLDNYDEPTTYIVDFKTVDPAVYQGVGEEQLKIYALGYKELTGKNADYMEFYNLDDNDRQSRQLLNDDLDVAKRKIVHAANEIRSNRLDKKCSKANCQTCYMAHLCLDKKKRTQFGVEARKMPG